MKYLFLAIMSFLFLIPSLTFANAGVTGCSGFGMMGAFGGGWMWLWMIFGSIISILIIVLLIILIWKLLEKNSK